MSELLVKCEVCRSLLDEEDLFCANCGTESPRGKEAPGRKEPSEAADSARQATHNFECSGCGASMSFDARAGSLRCPFCASVDMVQQKDAKILAPRRVVPFRLSRDEAVAAMAAFSGRVILEEFDIMSALGTFFVENGTRLPVAAVLPRAFHHFFLNL